MQRLGPVILGVALIGAAACGGGSSKPKAPAATPTQVNDNTFKAAAEAAVQAIQLAVADLPGGWTGTVHELSETQFDLTPECAKFNQHGSPTAVVDSYSDDFSDSADRGMSSEVAVYRTSELASKDAADGQSLISRCRDELARAFEASIVKDAPGATAHAAFEFVAPSELGGWTNGYKFSLSTVSASGAKSFHTDVNVFWQLDGRIITTFEYDGDKPIDGAMRDALKSLLAKRTADADAALPN